LGLHGARNGPGPFNGFVRTIEDAKAEFAAAGGAWLKAAGLSEDAPTAQRKDSDSVIDSQMRNFSEMFLRALRALEFSHGQDPKRS
jgi:hypothetical protein